MGVQRRRQGGRRRFLPSLCRQRVATRPFFVVSMASAVAALALALAVPLSDGTAFASKDLGQAHFVLAIFGFLIPGTTALHVQAVQRLLTRNVPVRKVQAAAWSWGGGALLLAVAIVFLDGVVHTVAAGVASLLLIDASLRTAGLLLPRLPKRKQSVVDVARDPLTKGDDASFTQARFAHVFLVAAMPLTLLGGPWWDSDQAWTPRVWLAGIHLLLAGYALVSTYALTHLWVPRLSKVPAIAAGAIKGELHSSLLGLVFLLAGFLVPSTGLAIAGGSFLFLGAFTWMGVLGANIMRNKSKTQRVTPEFTYIPWVFTGVFWLVCGVLLGVFLNAVPDALADRFAGLRFTHAHGILVGGMVQIALGMAMRLVPAGREAPPLSFHRAKWAFYALNLGLAVLLAGHLGAFANPNVASVGGLLVFLGCAAAFMSLARHHRRSRN